MGFERVSVFARCCRFFITTAVLAGCVAPPAARRAPTDVARRPLVLGGYRLATVPAADPDQFLGRRYDRSLGELGDRPCGDPEVERSDAGQMLTAEYNLDQSGGLEVGFLGFLTAGLDVSQVEKIEVELTTSSKASITVPSDCDVPVIYDAIAGTLQVRYYARQGASIRAATSGLSTAKLTAAEATYHVDEERRVASVTLDPELYIAYRVHHVPPPPPAPERRGPKRGAVVGAALFLTGLALFTLGYTAEPDCSSSGEHCMPSVGQVFGIGIGATIGLAGIITWGVSR